MLSPLIISCLEAGSWRVGWGWVGLSGYSVPHWEKVLWLNMWTHKATHQNLQFQGSLEVIFLLDFFPPLPYQRDAAIWVCIVGGNHQTSPPVTGGFIKLRDMFLSHHRGQVGAAGTNECQLLWPPQCWEIITIVWELRFWDDFRMVQMSFASTSYLSTPFASPLGSYTQLWQQLSIHRHTEPNWQRLVLDHLFVNEEEATPLLFAASENEVRARI